MLNKALILTLSLVALLLLAACGASVEPGAPAMAEESAMNESSSDDQMASEAMDVEPMASDDDVGAEHPSEAMEGEMADNSEEMASDEMASDEMDSDEMADMADLPAWQTLPLTNARTGETFALADFAGKTVFVEPMATWCTNCRRQLGNVKDAQAQLAGEEVVFIALSVETSIGDGDLANYANAAGFDWLFAVMTPEILQELAGEFGQTIANPPATPHFVIRPDGSVAGLVTGIEPAGDIVAQIQAAQG